MEAFRGENSATDQAITWLARLRAANVTVADKAAFAEWLHADPSHKNAFDETTELWHALDVLPPQPRAVRAPRYYPGKILTLAASFLVACAILIMQMSVPNFETGKGELRRVLLADGSTAYLNTQTQIRVQFDGSARHIELLQGEAWFDVVADPSRPFRVGGTHATIEAVGTAFAVREYRQSTWVGVSEGQVTVYPQAGADFQAMTLSADQQATASDEGARAAAFDPSMKLTWRQGQLVYDNERLEDLLSDLNRYLPNTMVVNDAELADVRVSAVLHLTDQPAMLDALARTLPIRWKSVADNLVIVARSGPATPAENSP